MSAPSGWTCESPANPHVLAGMGLPVEEFAHSVNPLRDRHYAASKGHVNVRPQEWLPAVRTRRLLTSCDRATAQIGRLLISKGADINARDRANQLPLCVSLASRI